MKGNKHYFELTGGSSYWRFKLPRVKLQYMYEGNPGEINLGLFSARLKLATVRVIGSRLYWSGALTGMD